MPGGPLYDQDVARVYDLLIHGEREACAEGHELEFLLRTFNRCPREVRQVLDVGCGTGRHLIPLARDGLQVTGLDSSDAMLAQCRRRIDRRDLTAELLHADMLELRERAAFDAVLCMDSTLNCLHETEDVLAALSRMGDALRPGGVLVLDSWNFFARWRRLEEPVGEVREAEDLRIDYRQVDWLEDFACLYHIRIDAAVREGDRRWEIHKHDVVRAVTPGELTAYLQQTDYGEIETYPGFNPESWSETSGDRIVATAVRP
ncbi:MAG: class I SAM-dependent methyltransferase [Planctomycetota bacterium]